MSFRRAATGLLPALLLFLMLASCLGCGSGGGVDLPTATPAGQANGNGLPVTISSPSGEVLVQEAGGDDFVQATAGMKLKVGDRITTGDDGSLLVIFFDGSVLEIGPDSDVTIEELARDDDAGSTTVRLRQFIGSTTSRVQQLADFSSSYEMETPAGTAVVRGTVFHLEVDESGYTELSTEEGEVWFSAGGVTVLVGAGEEASASPGSTPSVSFYVDNVEVCSEIRGYRDYDVQHGAFEPGATIWVYFEFFGASTEITDGQYEIWTRVSEARVYDPSGALAVSGTDIKDYHQTGLQDIMEQTWGDLTVDLLPSSPAGQYRLEAEIMDVISQRTDSFTVTFDLGSGSTK